MKKLTSGLAVAFLVLLSACSSSKNMIRLDPVGLGDEPVTGARPGGFKTGLIIDAELGVEEVSVKQHGCDLVFADSGKSHQYLVHLDFGNNLVTVEPPSGEYSWMELACPNGKVWTFQEMRNPPFQTWEAKLTYAGRLQLRKESKGSLVRRMDPPKEPKKIESIISKSELVSAFTGVKITSEMLSMNRTKSVTLEYFRNANEKDDAKKPKPDYFILDACDEAELAKNPVVIGKLEFRAKYNDGKFAELSDWKNESTYSKDYLDCIKDVVKKFKPTLKVPVAYKTAL